mgnify:CR=1 FL=1
MLSVSLCLVYKHCIFPDARRVAPIIGSVWCLRFVLEFSGCGTFTILQKLYLSSILHLTLIRCNLLTFNTLFSVRYCKYYLHATYTTCTLPRDTSTGGRYHSIGEQKSLLLRQNLLPPCAVKSTAYDKTDCEAAGVMCKMYAGVCKMF